MFDWVNSVQISGFSSSVFSRDRTKYGFSMNREKYEPEQTLYVDTFHAVSACTKTPLQHLILQGNEIKEMINPFTRNQARKG